jgi:hypothetical protein
LLRILLDEHLSPSIVTIARRFAANIEVLSIQSWRQGTFRSKADADILSAANDEDLTLLTRDLKTIPSLLKRWERDGLTHSGVIYVSRRGFAPGNSVEIARALTELWVSEKYASWINRQHFL